MLASALKEIENGSASAALFAALKAIPEGQVGATSRKAGIAHSAMARLRRGESLNIQIETLKRLALAMGKSADELIGLVPSDFTHIPEDANVTPAQAAKMRKNLERVSDVVASLLKALPADTEPKKSRS